MKTTLRFAGLCVAVLLGASFAIAFHRRALDRILRSCFYWLGRRRTNRALLSSSLLFRRSERSLFYLPAMWQGWSAKRSG